MYLSISVHLSFSWYKPKFLHLRQLKQDVATQNLSTKVALSANHQGFYLKVRVITGFLITS